MNDNNFLATTTTTTPTISFTEASEMEVEEDVAVALEVLGGGLRFQQAVVPCTPSKKATATQSIRQVASPQNAAVLLSSMKQRKDHPPLTPSEMQRIFHADETPVSMSPGITSELEFDTALDLINLPKRKRILPLQGIRTPPSPIHYPISPATEDGVSEESIHCASASDDNDVERARDDSADDDDDDASTSTTSSIQNTQAVATPTKKTIRASTRKKVATKKIDVAAFSKKTTTTTANNSKNKSKNNSLMTSKTTLDPSDWVAIRNAASKTTTITGSSNMMQQPATSAAYMKKKKMAALQAANNAKWNAGNKADAKPLILRKGKDPRDGIETVVRTDGGVQREYKPHHKLEDTIRLHHPDWKPGDTVEPAEKDLHYEVLKDGWLIPTKEDILALPTERQRKAYWTFIQRLNELRQYIQRYGDANVPQQFPIAHSLGVWVNKMRMEKKKYDAGAGGGLTDRKVELLEFFGFIWAQNCKGESGWEHRFQELKEFKEKYGHCDVPTKCSRNRALGRWVSTQRAMHKQYLKQHKQGSNEDNAPPIKQDGRGLGPDRSEVLRRILALEGIGFNFSKMTHGDTTTVKTKGGVIITTYTPEQSINKCKRKDRVEYPKSPLTGSIYDSSAKKPRMEETTPNLNNQQVETQAQSPQPDHAKSSSLDNKPLMNGSMVTYKVQGPTTITYKVKGPTTYSPDDTNRSAYMEQRRRRDRERRGHQGQARTTATTYTPEQLINMNASKLSRIRKEERDQQQEAQQQSSGSEGSSSQDSNKENDEKDRGVASSVDITCASGPQEEKLHSNRNNVEEEQKNEPLPQNDDDASSDSDVFFDSNMELDEDSNHISEHESEATSIHLARLLDTAPIIGSKSSEDGPCWFFIKLIDFLDATRFGVEHHAALLNVRRAVDENEKLRKTRALWERFHSKFSKILPDDANTN